MNFKEFFIQILLKTKVIIIILLIIFSIFKLIDLSHMRITAVFNELEPFSNIFVYYKGFKIGKAIKVTPSKDFLTTHVTIALNSWRYNLPQNIKIKVQKAQKDNDVDYMEIIYPSSPTIARIKYGDKIEGSISHDLSDLISDVANGKSFDEIKGNANNLLSSANDVAQSLSIFIDELTSILKEIRPDIKTSFKNFNAMSANLNLTAQKLEHSINDEHISNSILNFQNTSKNFEGTSVLINSKTIPTINATICSLKSLLDNINEIVRGVGKTLQKRMGGARLIFGTAVDKDH